MALRLVPMLGRRLAPVPRSTIRQLSTVGLRPQPRISLPRSVRGRPNSTITQPPRPSPPPPGPEPQPTSAYARFKLLTKTYGSYAILMYLALSAVDFSIAFGIVHAVGVERVEPYMKHVVRFYREVRHGKEGADALERADVAKKAAAEAEAAAELAISGPPTVRWWSNKALWAEAVLAYSIHKILFLPVRAGLTVAWTPKVVNWLSKRGWLGKVRTARQS